MSTEERGEAENAQRELTAALTPRDDDQTRKARFAIITDLLLSKPIAGATADVGRARGGAYRDALDDVPPWAIATAVRKWRRGEYGDDRNYTWAPDEALLRKLALAEMVPLREALQHISGLLAAIPLEEAMKAQTYAKSEYVVEGFKTLLADLPPMKGAKPKREAADPADRMRKAKALGRLADRVAGQAAE